MYANFTEETCTGTGATLALAGATTGNIPFSESFADGELVAYVLEDSGGTIKVAGIGTYVSATDDITRNDTWNWNGTAVDDNPSTNITLSGGTHTVRCDVIGEMLTNAPVLSVDSLNNSASDYRIPDNIRDFTNFSLSTPVADRLTLIPAWFAVPTVLTSFAIEVTTLDAAATNTRQGLYAADIDGNPDVLLEDSGNISVSTTGLKITNLSTPRKLRAGLYYFAFVTDSTTVRFQHFATGELMRSPQGIDPSNVDRHGFMYQNSVTGALPSTLTLTGYTNGSPTPCGFQ